MPVVSDLHPTGKHLHASLNSHLCDSILHPEQTVSHLLPVPGLLWCHRYRISPSTCVQIRVRGFRSQLLGDGSLWINASPALSSVGQLEEVSRSSSEGSRSNAWCFPQWLCPKHNFTLVFPPCLTLPSWNYHPTPHSTAAPVLSSASQ